MSENQTQDPTPTDDSLEALTPHPLGIPDLELAERPLALLIGKPPHDMTDEELTEHIAALRQRRLDCSTERKVNKNIEHRATTGRKRKAHAADNAADAVLKELGLK